MIIAYQVERVVCFWYIFGTCVCTYFNISHCSDFSVKMLCVCERVYCVASESQHRVCPCVIIACHLYVAGEVLTVRITSDNVTVISGALVPSPPLDNIRVMVIVWRLRGNIIRTAPCWVV